MLAASQVFEAGHPDCQVNEVSLSCGGTFWAKNGGVETGHVSTTGVTDDGRFASVVAHTFSAAVAEQSFKVLDAALCE